eukprot:6009212-Prymnesium_polylepis.1
MRFTDSLAGCDQEVGERMFTTAALMASARPVVLGLTGSIGMGKSTAAAWWRRLGIRVHGARKRAAVVEPLLSHGGRLHSYKRLHTLTHARIRSHTLTHAHTRALCRHSRADADATVHQLYSAGGAAVEPVTAAFPGTMAADGSIDRTLLSGALPSFDGGRDAALVALEAIVHPL